VFRLGRTSLKAKPTRHKLRKPSAPVSQARKNSRELYLASSPAFSEFRALSIFAVVEKLEELGCGTILQLARFPITNEVELVPIGISAFNDAFSYLADFTSRSALQVFPARRRLLLEIIHRSNEDVAFLVDGVPVMNAVMPLPSNAPRDDNGIGIVPKYSSCKPFHGNIFELLLYDRALIGEEREQAERYLHTKWRCCKPVAP
jgi:hypothetical protein